MDTVLKACAGVLITLVLCLILTKQGKDIPVLLSVAVCCMLALTMLRILDPVMDFLRSLETLGNLDSDMLRILLKAVGIGLIGEITAAICNDAGNAALGKTLQSLCAAVIVWMSIPLFEGLLELVQEILVAL